MNINGKTTLNNGYFFVAGMVLFVLIVSLFAYKSQASRLKTELKGKNSLIELLQSEYNDAAKELKELKEIKEEEVINE